MGHIKARADRFPEITAHIYARATKVAERMGSRGVSFAAVEGVSSGMLAGAIEDIIEAHNSGDEEKLREAVQDAADTKGAIDHMHTMKALTTAR